MMSKIKWKVIEVNGHELELELNSLSDNNYEVFEVQFINPKWSIVARKSINEKPSKTMGFSKSA